MYLKTIKKIKGNKNFKDAIYSYAQKLHVQNLPVIFNLYHLSKYIKTDYMFLHNLVSNPMTKHYSSFLIKKKFTLRKRKIYVPSIDLLQVQKWINFTILHKVNISANSTAYSTGNSNIKNAKKHLGSQVLIKADIANFFESITEKHVYKIFKNLGYTKYLSFCFTKICTVCEKNKLCFLPQGAPTSPLLANIVCKNMDAKLELLAQKYNLTYTRYSDDLAFSSKDKNLNFKSILEEIKSIIKSFNFKPHKRKTRVIMPSQRKIITGILLDSCGQKISVTKDYFLKTKTELYCMQKFGFINHCKKTSQRSPLIAYNTIKGRMEYIKQIDHNKWNKLYVLFRKIDFGDIAILAESVK